MKTPKYTTPERQRITRRYCKRWPDHGNLTIAKALRRDHPGVFPTLENARWAVRYVRGNAGKKDRKLAKAPRANAKGTVQMPETWAKPWTPFVFKERLALILSDIHVPFHDPAAVDAALEYGSKQRNGAGRALRPSMIYINGDFADFYSISRFTTDPTKRSFQDEVIAGRQMLAHIRSRFPRAKIVWKMGNHDERWEHYIWNQAPVFAELLRDGEVISLQAAYHLDESNVTLLKGRDRAMIDKLNLLHGHELQMGANSPVSAARTASLKTGECTLVGHWHHTSSQPFRTINGRLIFCWSQGCLCELTPEYARVNRWNHGAAKVHYHPRSGFSMHNFHISNGRVL